MANAAGQLADVHPLADQTTQKPTPSSRLRSPLDVLATVELQLCLQFLDTTSRLKAARCSRSLLQAADHPFAWLSPTVTVNSRHQPQLSSLINSSLLRHASIALELNSDLPLEEVAAIPRLRDLVVASLSPADRITQLLALPSLQRLQTLRVSCELPLSALQLLPALSALHTLHVRVSDDSGDWSWLPAMPALTHLDLKLSARCPFPPPLVDAVGQCATLVSLQLRCSILESGDFARLCSTPAMRQLRHLALAGFHANRYAAASAAENYGAAFSALAQLESLRLDGIGLVDLLLLHLAHAPALCTLAIPCKPEDPISSYLYGSTHPGFGMLRWLVATRTAPLLRVRLEMAPSIDEWRNSDEYRRHAANASDREEMDEQWRKLQRMAEQLDRVAIVAIDASLASAAVD